MFGPRPFFEGYITRPKSFNDAHVPWAIHWFPLEGSIKLGREMYISQDVQGNIFISTISEGSIV